MPKTILGGKEIEVDEDGFIQEPDKWDNAVAEDIAKTEDAFPMGEEHWKLVNYLRDYYLKYGIAPPVRNRSEKDLCPLSRRTGERRM
jgi:TusE/DsrC/DsvC family sulfur relay protein